MKRKIKKLLKRIKKNIVKKVIMKEYNLEDNLLILKMELFNFFLPIIKTEAFLVNKGESVVLPISLEKNKLVIKVPLEYLLEEDKLKSRITIRINNKEMWIKTDDSVLDYTKNIIVKNRYFTIKANKNITIVNSFSEFNFNEKEMAITELLAGYNRLDLTIEQNLKTLMDVGDMEIYGFSNNKFRAVDFTLLESKNQLRLEDMTLFSNGLWQLFIKVGKELYPLSFPGNAHGLNTINHKVEIVNIAGQLHLLFIPHVWNGENIYVSCEEESIKFVLKPAEEKLDQRYSLLLHDTKNNEEFEIECVNREGELIALLKKSHLLELSTYRFFLIHHGDEAVKCQFDLRQTNLKGPDVIFDEVIDHQDIKFIFYKRKDKSLGLKVKKPKIRKIINSIDEFSIVGYLGSMEKFINCQAYLVIEERLSTDKIRIPLNGQGEFQVDLKKIGLVGLKSKQKTVMDFFLVIENENHEVIRKEKIKYALSDYKKDNYYGRYAENDDDGNKHYFLLTTTPFNNLKIETYTIPSHIQIPSDTSIKDDNVWLIGERYNTAQDNGIALFKWIQANTEIEAYYVMESDAEDYERVKDIPNVLEFGSEKHFEISFKAKVLLGTHDLENILPYKPARGIFHYEDTIKIFLQHGVLGRKNVEYHKKFYDIPFDLFIVSSEPEKYDVVMDKLGYDEEEVVVTGLARFDNLIQDKKPKDILLMPTWRDWINTDEQFLESEYYAAYSNFIQNPVLLDLLEKYDVNLNFYPHYRAQEFFRKDITNEEGRIKFVTLGSKHVQELLLEHALLITDFSSVSFDFTLMKKPVIYYHFDAKRFFRRGILRPIEETFIGRIATTEEELISLVEDRLVHGLENFNQDIRDIIKFEDKNNSERIYSAVKCLTDGKILKSQMGKLHEKDS